MPRPFRFAVQGGPFVEPKALREHAILVEELGYDELFSSDHIGHVDPFVPLAVAAEATSTLRFGPLVLNNEFHNPVLLARTAATFDVLTGGRLILGIGTGYMASEHSAADIELRAPGPRVTRFGESLSALRGLLDNGKCAIAGEHIRLDIDDLGVSPAQTHVPILVGGHGQRVVSLAAKHADIFQFTGLTHEAVTGVPSAGGFAATDIDQRHRWLVDAAGPRIESIELSSLVQVTNLGEGADEAADAMAANLGVERSLVDETPFALFGSVDHVVDKIVGLRERFGISHFVVRDPLDFAPVVNRLAGQ